MKSSFVASGLVLAVLTQGASVHGQVFDLPDPGSENLPTVAEPLPASETASFGQYAGSLRLGPVLHKEGRKEFRIVLDHNLRLTKIDLRVLSGKAVVKEAFLISQNGQKIEVQNLRSLLLTDAGTIYSSENLSLNDSVAEILLIGEATSDTAEFLLTALADNAVPKLSLFQAPLNTLPNYGRGGGVGGWVPRARNTDECLNGFCSGDIVFYMRYRAVIDKIYPDGKVIILQRGVRRTLTSTAELVPLLNSPDRR